MITDLIHWPTGGAANPYHPLTHCMSNDWPWIIAVASMDLCIWVGYVCIAWHCRKQENIHRKGNEEVMGALRDVRLVYLLCGATYLWTTIDIFWPGWRLLALAKLVLAMITWRYFLRINHMNVIYDDLGEVKRLRDLNEALELRNKALLHIIGGRES